MTNHTPVETQEGDTLADLLHSLGDVPLERIRRRPPPGMATEEDVVRARDSIEKRLCELVEGVLVEKAMGTREGLLAGLIVYSFWHFLKQNKLGKAFGADSFMRLTPGLVRIPDVAFVSRSEERRVG